MADFGAVLLLSFLFSESEGGTASRLLAVAMFVAVIVVEYLLQAVLGLGALGLSPA